MSDKCPHVKGDTTMHCEQAERLARERDEARVERDAIQKAFDARADEFAEMRRESWLMGVRLREARDEVERLRDSLSVTGDTRHEAMEAAIRVAEAHSETIRKQRDEIMRQVDEVERLRASAKATADAARYYMARPMDDMAEKWERVDVLIDAALRGESVTTTPTPERND